MVTEVTYLISNLLITANRSDLAGSHIPNPKFTRKEKGEKKNFLEVVVYCLYFSKCLNISYCSRRLSHQLIHFYCEFGGKHEICFCRKMFQFSQSLFSGFEFLRVFFLFWFLCWSFCFVFAQFVLVVF